MGYQEIAYHKNLQEIIKGSGTWSRVSYIAAGILGALVVGTSFSEDALSQFFGVSRNMIKFGEVGLLVGVAAAIGLAAVAGQNMAYHQGKLNESGGTI